MKYRVLAALAIALFAVNCGGKKKNALMLFPLASLTAPTGSGSPASASSDSGSVCTQSSPGHSWGDPHLRTLDGLVYDFQGLGEYWLILGSENDFGIQVRQEPWNNNRRVTVNTAVATQIDGHIISLYKSGALYIDRAARTLASGGKIDVGTGSIRLNGSTYRFTYGDGSYFEVARNPAYINIYTTGLKIKQRVSGLLGNCNGNVKDDLSPRDASAAIAPITFNSLYSVYGDSWRLRNLESWFEYGAGQNPGSFDGTPQKIGPIDEAVIAQALTVCRAAGITNQVLLDACVLDVALTGDATMATWAANVPAPAEEATDIYYDVIAAITDNGSSSGGSSGDNDDGGSTGGNSGDNDDGGSTGGNSGDNDNGGSTGGNSGDDDDNGGSTGGHDGDDDDNGGSTGGHHGDDDDNGGSAGGHHGDDDDNGGSTGGHHGDDDDNGGSAGGHHGNDDDNGGSAGGHHGDDDDNGGSKERCKKGNSHASEKNHGVCSSYWVWGQKKKTL